MAEKILTREIVIENGWHKLETITADMLNGYTSIGDHAFCLCSGLKSITIPNSVTYIGCDAFYGCTGLTSVFIPNSVTYIGNYAFKQCIRLTSVTIPNGVTSIEEGVFYYCTALTSVTIPNSVTSIDYCAFSDCESLTSITIPNSVTYIGFCAFCGCSSLKSVNIPNSVTNIRISVFGGCGFNVEKRYDAQGRLIAYKAFNGDMSCRGFRYEEGETCKLDGGEIKLCARGFHACINPMDCLNYYWGKIGNDVVFHEVYLEDVSDESNEDSKVVARKITIGREITLSEMADIASGRK